MSAIHLTLGIKRGSYSGKAARFLTRERQEQSVIQSNASVRRQLTPRQAIREHCIDCAGSASNVRDCQGDELYDRSCIFFSYRMGKGRPSVRLIRKFCLFCMGGSWKMVKACSSQSCQFSHYRMGKNPNIRLSDEQRRLKKNAAVAARRHRLKPSKVSSGIESFFQDRRTEHV